MAENPFADLIPNGGSSGGDASPAPTPFTSYSIPAAVGGADESYDPYTAQGLGVNNIQLTPGVVAVNPSVNPLGTVFLNKDTGEAYIAADRHGNRNPNVVDIYKDPSDYRAESGQANLIPIDQIPLNQIPKSPAELKRLLSNYGKVPKSSAEDQQEQNPFSDLIPGSNQTIPTQPNQSVATDNPFSDLIPKQSSYGSQMIGGQGSIGPSAVTSSSMPWYSALGRSAAAQTAAGAIQTAGGFERAGAAPVTDISGINAPFQRGATTQEAKSAFDKAIADRQASLDAIQGIVKKQGFSTAEYGNQINDLQREIGDLQAQKEQTLKLPQYSPEAQQQLTQQRQQLGQQAGALSQQATGMFPALGVSQKDTSTAAQIGRGIGGVIDLAPGMLTGPLAFPTMATMAASQAYGEAYDTKVAELKQQGVTDPAQLDAAGHEAASKEAQKSAASTLPYAVFGPIAGEATSALLKGASPLVKGLIGGAAATGVNLGVSGGLRAAQGQPFLPNVEQAVPDILFGAVHGLGAGLEARAEAKKAADAQLGGTTPEVSPSSNPLVNEKEAQITANADQLHETPSPVINLPAATPEELAKSGENPITPAAEATTPIDNSQKILDLASQQFELDPNSKQYELIQQQIDALQKPAEARVAEGTTKEQEYAIQKQTTGEVGVRNAPTMGEGVGRENKTEVLTQEGQAKKEEVTTPTIETTGEGQLFKNDQLPFNLAGEVLPEEPKPLTIGTEEEQQLPIGEAPKPAEQEKPVNPYREVEKKYYTTIKSHSELADEVEKVANKEKNKFLKESVQKYRDALSIGADMEPEVEKLLSDLEKEGNYHDQGIKPSDRGLPKGKYNKPQFFGGKYSNDKIISYLQENKILTKFFWQKEITDRGESLTGRGEYNGVPEIPRKHAETIYGKRGRGQKIDDAIKGMHESDPPIGLDLEKPDDLWKYIKEASDFALKEEEEFKKQNDAEKRIREASERLRKLESDPEKLADAMNQDLKDYFDARRGGYKGDAAFFEFPDSVKKAVTDFSNAVYKAGMSFGDWSKTMISRLGEGVRDYLRQIWKAAKDYNEKLGRSGGIGRNPKMDESELRRKAEEAKYGPKPPSERETYAKGLAAHLTKVLGREPTQEELSKQVEKKFGKEEAPAPVAGGVTRQGEAPFGISEAAQKSMVESGELTHVSPSAEPVAQQNRLAKAGQALDAGADPEQIIRDLKAANIPDKIAQGMVYANQLKNSASEALRKYGYNSPEFKEAQKAHQDYQDRLKEAGSSQAGSALNIVGAGAKLNEARLTDTYDFANAFHDQTKGQDMTLSQIDKASKLAERNKKAEETTNKAQEDLSTIRDEGFSDVDVKTPESVDEARQQVADLSVKDKAEIERLNQENEKIKRDLEEVKQAQGQTAEELKAYYEAKIKDLENQQTPKFEKIVLDQAQRIVDKWKADRLEAEKLLKKQLAQLGSFPDVSIVATVARIMRGHISELGLDFARSSKMILDQFGPKAERFLKEAWDKAEKLVKGELGGEEAVKAVRIARTPKPKAKPIAKMSPEERRANNIRRQIERNQKIIDDINNGKISTRKDIEKVTNEEIQRLEEDLKQNKDQLKNAKLKEKKVLQFGGKITDKLNPEQAKTLWETAKKFYIPRMTKDAFYDEHRLIADIADDFGLTPNQVREAFSMPKGAKKASSDLFLQQQKRKQVLDNSRRWLIDQSAKTINRLFGKAAEQAFKLSVLGHGTAFITTHALPLWATHPIIGTKAFLRAMRYTFTAKNGRTQWIIDNNNIVNHPDYQWAIKGGADVNPFKYGTEKPQRSNPDGLLAKALDPITGGRGFDALHWMRMEYFSKEWRKLSPALQNEEMAKVIGDAVNTATGYAESKLGSHPIVRLALFAPKLYKSQFKWLIGDPSKMLGTAARMAIGKDVSPADAWQARHEAINKVKFIGMYASLLALNQAILSATGSNAKVNFTDPRKHDWLAFKTNDGSFNPLHPYIAIGRLLAKETHDLFSDYIPSVLGKKTSLEKSPGNNIKLALHDLGDYAFNKLSPIARQVSVLVNQRDFAGNAVPWASVAPLRGKEKLTWPQYIAEMFTPIPFSEASTQKDWTSRGAFEKLGSALLFGVPYTTQEDEEKWEESHKSKGRSSGSSGAFGSNVNTSVFGTSGGLGNRPFGQ